MNNKNALKSDSINVAISSDSSSSKKKNDSLNKVEKSPSSRERTPKTPNRKELDRNSTTLSPNSEDSNNEGEMEEKSSLRQWFNVKWREFSAMLFQGHKGSITDMIVTDETYHYSSHLNTIDKTKQPYWLITCGVDGDIRQYQILTCQCMKKFTPHAGGMEILFINNHPYLFSFGNDGVINCHNLRTGTLFRKYDKSKDASCYFISPKTKSIFIGTTSGRIYRYDLISTQEIQKFSGLTQPLSAIYHRKDLTKECLYTCCSDGNGRIFTMDGKTERLIRIKKIVKKIEFTKQRQLYMVCDDGTFLTVHPEICNILSSEQPVTEGTLVTYKNYSDLMYYTIKEDNYIHVLDTKQERLLRSFKPHGDKVNAIQVTGNTFLWSASDDGSILQTHLQLNTTEREFKSRAKDTLIHLIELVVSLIQLLSYPFLSYSDIGSIVMGFFNGKASIFTSDTAITIYYHIKLIGTILALVILFFILYKQYVPIYRHNIEMIELYGNLHGPDQSSRRSKSKSFNNKSGKTNYFGSTVSTGDYNNKSNKNLNYTSPKITAIKVSPKRMESTNESTIKPPPEPISKIISKSPVAINNNNRSISSSSLSHPLSKSPDISNELDDKNEEKTDNGNVTPKQFSRMKMLKKFLWFYIWICTTSLFIPFLSVLFGIFHCSTFYEKSENYDITGNYTTHKGISSSPQLECWSTVHIIYIIISLIMIILFLLLGTRLHRLDGDIEYMSPILRLSDWFRTWNNDRFQLYSDILVKVTMSYNLVDAIIKIIIAITDSVADNGNIGAGIVYTLAALVLFITGIFYPPHARTGMNYFLAATNSALVWCNCCSLIASAKANCQEGPEECDTEPYFPLGYFLGFIIPLIVLAPRAMEGKTALFQCKFLCCKTNQIKPDEKQVKKRSSLSASPSLGFDNDSKRGILRSISKVSTPKPADNDLDANNNNNNNNNHTPLSTLSVNVNTPSVNVDANVSNPPKLAQSTFGNKKKVNIVYNNSSNDTPNSFSPSTTPLPVRSILNTKKHKTNAKSSRNIQSSYSSS